MPLSYRVNFPESIKIVNLSGEADGHQYTMLVEAETNRILFIANDTLLSIRQRGELPAPIPVTYAPYHTLQSMNIRLEPNTAKPAINGVPVNTDLMLSTEPVTQQLLQRLGLGVLEIEAGYEWRHLQEGNFIASKIGTKDTVAEGPAPVPSTPPPSPNLKAVNANGKLSVAIKGTVRPVEGFVNMRALAFCGLPRVNGTAQGDIVRHLDAAQSLGVRLVRFYTACVDLDGQTCIDRVEYVLNELHKRNMLGILVLNDSLASGFHIAGDENYRLNMPLGHLGFEYYHRQAYKGNYFAHVRNLMVRVANHPAIASWDIQNETGGYGRPDRSIPDIDTQAIKTFAKDTIAIVRTWSSHWINWGLINAAHVGCDSQAEAEAFYRGLGLNIMSVHLYDEEHGGWVNESRALSDMGVAKKLGMPIWIDEMGVFFRGSSRKGEYESAVNRFKSWSAGLGFWGLNALSPQMNFSDALGVSVHLPDYAELSSLIRSYA